MTEDQIEQFAIDLLKELGWDYVHSSVIASGPKLMSGKVRVKGVE